MLTVQDKVPLISVLMGVYHRKQSTELLQRSVWSILSQTCSDFEFLICDDGSTEAAKAVIDAFSQMDKRIRLVRPGNLITLPEKLNACLRIAKGSLIARMDDDDFAHKDRFEKQVAYLVAHAEVGFIGSNVNLCIEKKKIGIRQLPERPQVNHFLFVQPFVHPTLMFRREVLFAIGGYSEEKFCNKCEDYDLLLRLYEYGYQGANLQECLLDYTVPATAKGTRTMGERWNEVKTRYRRFGNLGLLPKALPYVIKPLVVGLLPEKILARLKNFQRGE